MQLRKLGRDGPDLSVVGYGAWEIGGEEYGPNPGDEKVVEVIRAALEAGTNWIDTAEIYGDGTSERLVGKAVSDRRDEVIVATKVAPQPVGSGYRAKQIRKAVRASLKRLQTEHTDLYQLHWWAGEDPPIEETWQAMAGLVDEGLVRAIGVSNFNRAQIERCLSVRHCDSLQPELSMLYRKNEDLIAWCEKRGIGTVVYGPLAYGLLSGAISKNTVFHHDDWRSGNDSSPYYQRLFAPPRLNQNLESVEALRKIPGTLGVTLTQLALAWAIHRPGVTSAIAGSRNPTHVRENAQAGELAIQPAAFKEVEAILERLK